MGGMIGTGVPWPDQPKSQMQRKATANPSAEGTAANQRQRAEPIISTRKPSHCGKSQNHNPRKAVPAKSEAISDGQGFSSLAGERDCSSAISPTVNALLYWRRVLVCGLVFLSVDGPIFRGIERTVLRIHLLGSQG